MLPLLSIKNLSLAFHTQNGKQAALKDISFSIYKNEIVAIVGESGSGKSVTALSILKLLSSPPAHYTSGEILFSEDGIHSTNLLKSEKDELQGIRGNKIAMIFQEPMTSLNPVLTCGDQVTEALITHKKINKQEAIQQTIEWFKKVKLPDPEKIVSRYPHELSGGQKQRVMIALAMCCQPSLLVCDEPTTALDVTVQKTILKLLKELQQQYGMSVIFITHDLGVVAEIADRAIVMYRGEMVEDNDTKSVFNTPRHPYTKALLACRPANHTKGERLPVVSDFLDNTRQCVKENKEYTSVNTDRTDEALIEVKNLSVHYPLQKSFWGKPRSFFRAVDDVSFDVYKGETLGLVGESGCGKTTLGRTLLRLIEPTSGTIYYKGNDLLAKTGRELTALRRDMQIIFQDPYSSLNPRITIGKAIEEPLKVHTSLSATARKNKVIELLEKTGLKAEHFSRYPHEFSGGQRQRIVIARALALQPSFIVCDESVSALDVSVQAQVLNLLNDLKEEFNFTAIFISHDLSVVRYISDRIMVMNKGKIIETGNAEEIWHNPAESYTQQLIKSIPGKQNIIP